MNRKEFLQNSAKGVALTTLLPSLAFCTSNGQQKTIQGNYQVSDNFEADVDIELTASQSELQLFSGNQTRVYSYQPKLLKGEKGSLEELPGSYLGPVIRVRKVQKDDLNIKGAFLHMAADAGVSLGVVVAGLLINLTGIQ